MAQNTDPRRSNAASSSPNDSNDPSPSSPFPRAGIPNKDGFPDGTPRTRVAAEVDAATPGIAVSTYEPPDPERSSYFFRAPSFGPPRTPASSASSTSTSSQQPGIVPTPTRPVHPPRTPAQFSSTEDPGLTSIRRKNLIAAAMKAPQSIADIRAAHPNLDLNGNVISATFTIPLTPQYRKGADWELKPRRGQSALLDSFAYLSSDASPWNHTVVAWTGEIEEALDVPSPPGTPPRSTTHLPSLNSLSAPVPIDSDTRLPTPPIADGLWVTKEDQQRLEEQLARSTNIRTVPVWLADDQETTEEGIHLKDQSRWRRYAEHDLYTLFHYKQNEPSDGRRERITWTDYYRMNQKFAKKIVDHYKPGDIVIVHDFYLMLLPSMLRQRVPNMFIVFFLHSPFPSSEFLRCLPRRKEVLEGVLGSNLVGFQSYSFSRHFSSCCTRILGFPSDNNGVDAYGARVQVGVFPIGISASKCESYAWSDAVTEKYHALKKMYEGKKIIVGRDRLDSVRGVAQKLQAFERFLEMYPEWREKVVLIQVTSPTVTAEHDDQEKGIGTRVNELVMHINGLYGSLGFSPVQYYPQHLNPDEYFALLRAADIGLITSVRDGMNTTSLEYIVCQRDSYGPLIISEFSGTAGTLRDAIHINPWDLNNVATEINNALVMPLEKRKAMQESLYSHVTTRDVRSWINHLLSRLIHVLAREKNTRTIPLLDRAVLLQTYRDAKKRLIMFDYDGTLTPIVREPSAATPSETLLQTLTVLAEDPKNAVWIISGRDQEFLSRHLGHITTLGFSAEHGSFMKEPGSEEWINLADKFDMGWQAEVMDVFQRYTDRVPGAFIERKRCALTWHYRLADPDQGAHMSRECQEELMTTVAKKWDVEVMTGKANLEVRPTFINKGEITKRLVATYNAKSEADGFAAGNVDFVLCMGDDFTDEDMFRALSGLPEKEVARDRVFLVTVGASTKVTLAHWHLLEPADVVDSAALLAGVGKGGDTHRRQGQVNLAALSTVEGQIPETEKL